MIPAQNIFAQRAGMPGGAPVSPMSTMARPVMQAGMQPGQMQPGNFAQRPVMGMSPQMPMQPQQPMPQQFQGQPMQGQPQMPVQQPALQQAPQNFMRQRLGMY